MADIMKIGLILAATDKTYGGINSVQRNLGKLAGQLGLIGAAYAGFDAITRYDDAIQSLSAVTGVGGQDLINMKAEVISLAKESKKSGDEIAAAFEKVGSNMSEYLSDPKGLRDISSAGIILAKAARMDVAPALDDLTTIMNQFDLKAKDAAKSINILTAGEIVGNVRTSEISQALKEFGASASGANVNLGESVALIEVLGKKMDKGKIGVAGRNILTALSAAKGLDKEALKYLDAYGVSTDKLMNTQTPLIERLTELSKISGDATAMVKVFGKENITAATILLKNLPLYTDWENKIQNTSEAQNQADKNSASFLNRLKEMKSAFDNVLISQNENTGALNAMGGVIGFVTRNMGPLLNLVLLVTGATLAYIAVVKTIRAVMFAWNVVLGINAAFTKMMPITMKANVVALKAYTVATKIAAGAMRVFNLVTANNPIGWIFKIVMALGIALPFLIKHWDKVTDAIKRFGYWIMKMAIKPITFMLDAIGKLTGANWAINMSANLKKFSSELGTEKGTKTLQAKALPKASIGGNNVNYSPTVNIQGPVSQTDKDQMKKMLWEHKKEIAKINKENQANTNRIAYAQ